ncbi:S-adenosyl-L-methionine-dependent methyltransferase [Auricularia subglabra TFB-10046 SS5]|nr:S-adenosyl-L-methionine-dependent methyltransferase [Auricularia subglabra TFB-10046 SS5]
MEPIDHILNANSALEGVGLASEVIIDDWDDESSNSSSPSLTKNAVKIKLGAIFASSLDLGAYASGDSPWNLDSKCELFALLHCDDVPLSTLDGPPVDLIEPSYPLAKAPIGLFCTYLHDGAAFIHLSRYSIQRKVIGACFVCGHDADRERHTEPPADNQRARKILGINYHIYDFVYLRHDTTGTAKGMEGVSVIARILTFTKKDGGVVRVQVCERAGNGVLGQRELQLSTKRLVPAQAIVARCRVVFGRQDADTLLREPDMFFLDVDPNDVLACEECTKEDEAKRDLEDEFDEEHDSHALRMFDPYSGPGGLSLGIERGSRCIRSSYAVDIDESTVKTFCANSEAVCFHDDANHFLESILVRGSRITSIDGRTHSLQAGANFNVDVICAGVPCQGHSRLNIHRGSKEGEHNNQQMLTALSLVEVLRPRYVCIENVPAIDKWALKMRRETDDGIPIAADPHGGLRLTITILLALGYQVRVGILQAGNYGTPQSRRRFILLAAEFGSTLPDLPRPITAFDSHHGLTLKSFPKVKVPWPVWDDEDTEGDTFQSPLYVPHCSVTVGDAIGDLQPFDWSPGIRAAGASSKIDSFPCDPKTGCEPDFATPYAFEPQNEYQLRARNSGDVTDVPQLQHITAGYPSEVVRKICSMSPTDADYRGMGSHRKSDYMISDPVSSTGRKGFAPGVYYRRLNNDDAFSTLVTKVHPTGKQSQVIHPSQNRLISVREMARGQGFPDSFRFEGSITEMQHQLGNAVPVPLGEAIGRQIRVAMFKDWCEERARSKQRSLSPEL